jgi:hypothetical protein
VCTELAQTDRHRILICWIDQVRPGHGLVVLGKLKERPEVQCGPGQTGGDPLPAGVLLLFHDRGTELVAGVSQRALPRPGEVLAHHPAQYGGGHGPLPQPGGIPLLDSREVKEAL